MKTFKALSALLTYPSNELKAALPEIRAALRDDALLQADTLRALEDFLDDMGSRDLYDLQERYVFLFDRSRALSLHLFEHVHGESRDRGQAMVDLARLYERNGAAIAAGELPDYLPLFLEFLSVPPLAEAQALLGEAVHIVAALRERLEKRDSPYAAVFAAVEELSADPADQAAVEDTAKDDVASDDLAALDREWEETAVTFGPGEPDDGCSVNRLRTRLRAAGRNPASPG